MRRISTHPTCLETPRSEDAVCWKQRTAQWASLSLSPRFLNCVEHGIYSFLHHVEIYSKVQRMLVMGFERRCSGSPARRHALSCMNILVAAAVILSCASKAVTGLTANGGQAGEASGDTPSGSNSLLFAEPLYSDGIAFVTARLNAALSGATPFSDMTAIAAEAASVVSWSECSHFCNGGSQTADNERARQLAVEGLRRALSNGGEWSDSYANEVEKKVAQFTMDGDPAAGQVKTRPCNTFKCPFEVPTDLKTASLQIAQDPALVASFGVVPQVDFTESCKERLMLDHIDQEIWTARRTEHLNYKKVQERAGDGPGWEASVLASDHLNLYSCIALCRLHFRCSAVVYAKDIVAMQMNGDDVVSEDLKGDAMNMLESAMAGAGYAISSLDESLAKLFALDAESVGLNSPSGSPVCTLYTGVKVSRVAECGAEPTKKAGTDTLTLLVTNLDIDFGVAARIMRASMAQQLARVKSVLNDANLLVSRESIKNSKAPHLQQRVEQLTARLQTAIHRAQVANSVLPEAIRMMEGAAVDAVKARHAAQSADTATQDSRFSDGEEKSSLQCSDGRRPAFYSAAPLSASCPVFSGVELLSRGCVQLPALQTHSSSQSSTSSVGATEAEQASEMASLMTWRKCQGILQDVAQHLEKYRTAVSQSKASGEDATNAEKEAKRLLPLVLGLSAEETWKLSSPDIHDRLQAETGLMNKDFAKFVDEKDTLELRRDVVERLGQGTGTIFAVFDKVLEPRHAENGATLGDQFPSACASFSPFSLMILLPGSADSGGINLESEGSSSGVSTCEDVSCTYSPWTSWSPCDDSYQLEDENTDESRSTTEGGSDGEGRYRPAMWQVRVKEALARPKLPLQCNAVIETRLCKDRATADSENSGLMEGFTAAIYKSISSWCVYSPYSEWSECSPKCIYGDTSGVIARQTRTRTVHQYPVPGLASGCGTVSLEMQRACGAVPHCSNGDIQEGRADATGDQPEKGFDRESYIASSAIHLHSHTSVVDTEAPSSGRRLLNSLAKRKLHASILPYGGPEYYMTGAQTLEDNSQTKPLKDVPESFVINTDSMDDIRSGETAGQQLDKSAMVARTQNEPLAIQKDSTIDEEGSKNPDAEIPPVVAADSENDESLNSAPEGSTAGTPPMEIGATQNLTAEDNTASAPPTVGGSTQDLSVVTQPQEDQVTIPYDSPFTEATVVQKLSSGGTALTPTDEKDHGSPELAHPQDERLTIPYDSPLGANKHNIPRDTSSNASDSLKEFPVGTKPALEGNVESTQRIPEGDAGSSESFFLGLSCFSFVGCCLFGALASTVLVLMAVVCSKSLRSWLGYDWSGATEEEHMALLREQAAARSLSAAAPLVNPKGTKVLRSDGAPLVVSPCLTHSGGQYVTSDGSQIFVTMEGGFVNSWGKPIQANELPKELLTKVDAALPKNPSPSVPLPGTNKEEGQVNGKSASISPPAKMLFVPKKAANAQGKQLPFGASFNKVGPLTKQVAEVRRSAAAPLVKAKMAGMPPPKAPGNV